jgi:hypothetical protein
MADIATENYKKNVTSAVDRWGKKVEAPAKQVAKLDGDIAQLEAKKPASDDDKKKLADATKAYVAQRKLIETANTELRVDLMLLELPQLTPASEKELIKLPDFIKEIVKAKGISLGAGVSIAPDVKSISRR